MTARLELAVLVVLGAYLADLKGEADVAVLLALLLGDLDARGGRDGDGRRDVDADVASVRVDVERLLLAVDERLHQRLRYRLQDLVLAGHVADGPLAQLCATQPEQVAARLVQVLSVVKHTQKCII